MVWKVLSKPGKLITKKPRFVIDIRELNRNTEDDIYLLLRQEDIITVIRGMPFISCTDGVSYFFQWPVHPEDRELNVLITKRGLEQLNVAV